MKILLLHGALGCEEQMYGLKNILSSQYEVFTFSLPGHGSNYVDDYLYDINTLKDSVALFIQNNFSEPIAIFGYSLGGYLATLLATEGFLLINKIICLGTKWQWSPIMAQREVLKLNPDLIEEKVPQLAAMWSKWHGQENWKNVVNGTAQMFLKLGDNPLIHEGNISKITCDIHLLRGTDDQMVSLSESKWIESQIYNAKYEELQNQKHPIEQVDIKILSDKIFQILGK